MVLRNDCCKGNDLCVCPVSSTNHVPNPPYTKMYTMQPVIKISLIIDLKINVLGYHARNSI